MRIPSLLVLSLLISLCVATAAAQSSPQNSSQPSTPAPPQAAQASPDVLLFQLQPGNNSRAVPVLGPHIPRIVTLEQDEATCYTIRAYRVARENPDSDMVRPAGYSTCLRASRFQFKTAVDSREITPR
jgi:hypothetical protein